jgi:hypothetical protein
MKKRKKVAKRGMKMEFPTKGKIFDLGWFK